MCIGLPMQVVELRAGHALCRHNGAQHLIDTALVPDAAIGDWLMTFLGAAREKMDETSARQSLAATDALAALMRGEAVDLDAAFADLVGRTPQLPEHLRPSPEPQA
jgi:hydrogenase expression/formation protein HypC